MAANIKNSWRERCESNVQDIWQYWFQGSLEWSASQDCDDWDSDSFPMVDLRQLQGKPEQPEVVKTVADERHRCHWVCRRLEVIRWIMGVALPDQSCTY